MNNNQAIAGFEPIVSRATNQQAYDQVRAAISSGAYRPGETISTRQVASALGISQTPVREAFQRLVADRGLEKRSNRTFGLPLPTLKEFEEITEIRQQLEGNAAAKAALNGTEVQLKSIQSALSEMEKLLADQADTDFLELNRRFHFAVYEAAGSRVLVDMIDQLWLRIGPSLRISAAQSTNAEHSMIFHRRVFDALVAREAAAARGAISEDIAEAAGCVRRWLIEENLK